MTRREILGFIFFAVVVAIGSVIGIISWPDGNETTSESMADSFDQIDELASPQAVFGLDACPTSEPVTGAPVVAAIVAGHTVDLSGVSVTLPEGFEYFGPLPEGADRDDERMYLVRDPLSSSPVNVAEQYAIIVQPPFNFGVAETDLQQFARVHFGSCGGYVAPVREGQQVAFVQKTPNGFLHQEALKALDDYSVVHISGSLSLNEIAELRQTDAFLLMLDSLRPTP